MNTRDTEGMAQANADEASPLWSQTGEVGPAPGPKQQRARAGFRILVVEPLPAHREELVAALQGAGFGVTGAADLAQALGALAAGSFHLVICELRLPDGSALSLLTRLRAACPHTAVFVLAGQPSIASSVSAVKLGAAEYLSKPLDPRQLLALCHERCEAAPRSLPNALLAVPAGLELGGLIAHGPPMREVLHALAQLAAGAAPVLLLGEAGSGKALAAQALHRASGRTGRFARFCAPVDGGSAERLLIRLRECAGGTLFVDDLGDLPAVAQSALRELLDPREAPEPIRREARLVLGSRLDERELGGRLDGGLWNLLRGRVVKLPPLRARRDDLLPLALRLLREIAAALSRPPLALSAEAEELLCGHAWPGNVSELRAVLEHAVLRTPGGVIGPAALPLSARLRGSPRSLEIPVGTTLHEVERRLLHSTLEHCAGNRSRAASTLGISRSCLYDMLERHRAGPPHEGAPRAGDPGEGG
jgi:DNA-binding NtrC family response regulator